MECAISKTPIVSTPGMAKEILHHDSIYTLNTFKNAKPMVDYAYEKSKNFASEGMKIQRNVFLSL